MGCGRCVGPFECCTIIQGDCIELIARVPSSGVALISDPPYGMNYIHGKEKGQYASKFGGVAVVGDDKPFDPTPFLRFPKIVLFGGNHFASRLPDSAGWIVWDKRCGMGSNDQSDCELAWTNIIQSARVVYHEWNGYCRASERNVPRVHPTQKPIAVMQWIIHRLTEPNDLIVDPFSGSGTTAVAARKLDRHFLAFELLAEYCERGRERLASIEAQPNLFTDLVPE